MDASLLFDYCLLKENWLTQWQNVRFRYILRPIIEGLVIFLKNFDLLKQNLNQEFSVQRPDYRNGNFDSKVQEALNERIFWNDFRISLPGAERKKSLWISGK